MEPTQSQAWSGYLTQETRERLQQLITPVSPVSLDSDLGAALRANIDGAYKRAFQIYIYYAVGNSELIDQGSTVFDDADVPAEDIAALNRHWGQFVIELRAIFETKPTDIFVSPFADEYGQGLYPQAQYDQGLYPQAQYDQGLYPQAQYDQGLYPQAQYDQGQYPQAQYDQGQYDQSQYDQGRAATTDPKPVQPDAGQYPQTWPQGTDADPAIFRSPFADHEQTSGDSPAIVGSVAAAARSRADRALTPQEAGALNRAAIQAVSIAASVELYDTATVGILIGDGGLTTAVGVVSLAGTCALVRKTDRMYRLTITNGTDAGLVKRVMSAVKQADPGCTVEPVWGTPPETEQQKRLRAQREQREADRRARLDLDDFLEDPQRTWDALAKATGGLDRGPCPLEPATKAALRDARAADAQVWTAQALPADDYQTAMALPADQQAAYAASAGRTAAYRRLSTAIDSNLALIPGGTSFHSAVVQLRDDVIRRSKDINVTAATLKAAISRGGGSDAGGTAEQVRKIASSKGVRQTLTAAQDFLAAMSTSPDKSEYVKGYGQFIRAVGLALQEYVALNPNSAAIAGMSAAWSRQADGIHRQFNRQMEAAKQSKTPQADIEKTVSAAVRSWSKLVASTQMMLAEYASM